MKSKLIGIIGAGAADVQVMSVAELMGRLLAERGFTLVCGGLGGVMEAAAKGAKMAGGTTVGILPQADDSQVNPYIDIAIPTGFGEGRNVFIIRSAELLIAIAGEYGTLSEIAFALKSGKNVIGLGTWDIPGIIKVETPEEAVDMVITLLGSHL